MATTNPFLSISLEGYFWTCKFDTKEWWEHKGNMLTIVD
jgi:hypothetical protein